MAAEPVLVVRVEVLAVAAVVVEATNNFCCFKLKSSSNLNLSDVIL